MKNNLYKISQVAKFLSVTTTTLRYYEAEGLLTPAYIDPNTKYRFYDVNNINTVAYILALRDAGASMMQIKSYFNNQNSMQYLLDELIEQHNRLQKRIDFLQDVFNSDKQSHVVKQITMPTVQYISSSYVAKDFDHAFELIENFLGSVVATTSLTSSPVTFVEYDSLDFVSTNFPMTIGIEVDSAKTGTQHRPSQKAIRTIHHGTYDTLPQAYDALLSYAQLHHLELQGNVYEYYYESLNLRHDPADYVTEVIMPLK